MTDRQCNAAGAVRSANGAGTLAGAFAVSPYAQERYEHWPLGRRVHAFLAEQSGIDDYESVFLAVYGGAVAARGVSLAAG